MTTTSAHTAATLPDPRETDLSMEQLYMDDSNASTQTIFALSQRIASKDKLIRYKDSQIANLTAMVSQLQEQQPTTENTMQNGKRKEVIAILNVIYETMVDKTKINKTDFFRQQATAFGDAGLAEYAVPLNHIMNSQKYERIFDDAKSAALIYRENQEKT